MLSAPWAVGTVVKKVSLLILVRWSWGACTHTLPHIAGHAWLAHCLFYPCFNALFSRFPSSRWGLFLSCVFLWAIWSIATVGWILGFLSFMSVSADPESSGQICSCSIKMHVCRYVCVFFLFHNVKPLVFIHLLTPGKKMPHYNHHSALHIPGDLRAWFADIWDFTLKNDMISRLSQLESHTFSHSLVFIRIAQLLMIPPTFWNSSTEF